MSLFKAMQFIKTKDHATVPMVSIKFKVSQSTADNWLRRGKERGFLKGHRPKPGDLEGIQGSVGRPTVQYSLTAKGEKALKAGQLPGGDRSGGRMPKRKAAKGKAAPKSKARPRAKVAKKAKPAPKTPAKAGRKPLTATQKEAKNAADRKRRADKKAAKAQPEQAAA